MADEELAQKLSQHMRLTFPFFFKVYIVIVLDSWADPAILHVFPLNNAFETDHRIF